MPSAIRNAAALAICGAALAIAPEAGAAIVGQPFFEVSADAGGAPSGSILDFFTDFGEPSGLNQVSLTGTITSAFGAVGAVGKALAFSTSVGPGSITGALTLGATVLDGAAVFPAFAGAYDFDPFQGGDGDLNFAFSVFPPFDIVYDAPGDLLGTIVYGGDFSDFPDREEAPGVFPELDLVLSVYLDGPLPLKLFEYPDDAPPELEDFPYVEGPLPISRITLGLEGGEPLTDPMPPIPVPPALPLLAGGLLLLGLSGRLARLSERRSRSAA